MPGSLSYSPAREPGNKTKVEKCEGAEAQGVPRGREGCKCGRGQKAENRASKRCSETEGKGGMCGWERSSVEELEFEQQLPNI